MRSSAGSGKTYSPSPARSPSSGASAAADLGADLVAVEPSGLDHGHEGRRRVLVDLDERVLVLDGLEVGVRADGGLGGDDADTTRPRGQRGGRGARSHDAQRWARRSAARIVGRATAEDVLQATTMALTSREASTSRHCRLKRTTSSSARGPYGARALSPR